MRRKIGELRMAKFWKLLKLNNIYMVIYYRILSTLLCVAPGGRWFPTLGKFTMNLIGPKENKGERLRIKGFYSHVSSLSSLQIPAACLTLSPRALHSLLFGSPAHSLQPPAPLQTPLPQKELWAGPWWLMGACPSKHRNSGEDSLSTHPSARISMTD